MSTMWKNIKTVDSPPITISDSSEVPITKCKANRRTSDTITLHSTNSSREMRVPISWSPSSPKKFKESLLNFKTPSCIDRVVHWMEKNDKPEYHKQTNNSFLNENENRNNSIFVRCDFDKNKSSHLNDIELISEDSISNRSASLYAYMNKQAEFTHNCKDGEFSETPNSHEIDPDPNQENQPNAEARKKELCTYLQLMNPSEKKTITCVKNRRSVRVRYLNEILERKKSEEKIKSCKTEDISHAKMELHLKSKLSLKDYEDRCSENCITLKSCRELHMEVDNLKYPIFHENEHASSTKFKFLMPPERVLNNVNDFENTIETLVKNKIQNSKSQKNQTTSKPNGKIKVSEETKFKDSKIVNCQVKPKLNTIRKRGSEINKKSALKQKNMKRKRTELNKNLFRPNGFRSRGLRSSILRRRNNLKELSMKNVNSKRPRNSIEARSKMKKLKPNLIEEKENSKENPCDETNLPVKPNFALETTKLLEISPPHYDVDIINYIDDLMVLNKLSEEHKRSLIESIIVPLPSNNENSKTLFTNTPQSVIMELDKMTEEHKRCLIESMIVPLPSKSDETSRDVATPTSIGSKPITNHNDEWADRVTVNVVNCNLSSSGGYSHTVTSSSLSRSSISPSKTQVPPNRTSCTLVPAPNFEGGASLRGSPESVTGLLYGFEESDTTDIGKFIEVYERLSNSLLRTKNAIIEPSTVPEPESTVEYSKSAEDSYKKLCCEAKNAEVGSDENVVNGVFANDIANLDMSRVEIESVSDSLSSESVFSESDASVENFEDNANDDDTHREIVSPGQISPMRRNYQPVNKNAEVRSLHVSLMQTRTKKPSSNLSVASHDWDTDGSVNDTQVKVKNNSYQSHSIFVDKKNGKIETASYVDFNLIVVQESTVSLWNQTALGNVLGAQNLWVFNGCTQKLFLNKECVPKKSIEMVISLETCVAYIELWTKEHKSDIRQGPVADVFATIYFWIQKQNKLDKKVLQIENINGFADDVQYVVLRSSLNVVVSWHSVIENNKQTIIHVYNFAPDFQTIATIRTMTTVDHYVSSLHNIEDCDSLLMGCGERKITIWNIEHGYIVATVELNDVKLSLSTLWVKCDRGILFTVQQCVDRELRLIAINGRSHSWKRLKSYVPPSEYDRIQGAYIENGVLISFYEQGILCWNAQTGQQIVEETRNETECTNCISSGRYIIMLIDDQIIIRHALTHLLTAED